MAVALIRLKQRVVGVRAEELEGKTVRRLVRESPDSSGQVLISLESLEDLYENIMNIRHILFWEVHDIFIHYNSFYNTNTSLDVFHYVFLNKLFKKLNNLKLTVIFVTKQSP